MAPLQMYVVLSVFVFACKDGKFSAFLNCYFISIISFFIAFLFAIEIDMSILCFNFNYLHEKKIFVIIMTFVLCSLGDINVLRSLKDTSVDRPIGLRSILINERNRCMESGSVRFATG